MKTPAGAELAQAELVHRVANTQHLFIQEHSLLLSHLHGPSLPHSRGPALIPTPHTQKPDVRPDIFVHRPHLFTLHRVPGRGLGEHTAHLL